MLIFWLLAAVVLVASRELALVPAEVAQAVF
jgi:hypothetical protein